LHERYRNWGLSDEDAKHVDAFEHWGKSVGLSRADRDRAYEIYQDGMQAGLRGEDLIAHMVQQAQMKGADARIVEAGRGWIQNVATLGPDHAIPKRSRGQDEVRAIEIESNMKSKGGLTDDERIEWHDVLERLGEGEDKPTAEKSRKAAAPSNPRKSELEAMMADEWSDYHTGKNRDALKAEYRGILEKELGTNTGSSTGGWAGEHKPATTQQPAASAPSTQELAPQQNSLEAIDWPDRGHRGGRY
jgi:hypothetical protein